MSDAAHASRTIAAGPLAFTVASDDPAVARRFDHLLAAFPDAPTGPGAPDPLVVTVVRRPGPADLYDSAVDGEVVGEAMTLAEQEYRVSRVLNERSLDAEPDRLHVHGAAVARDGVAVVLVGRSGAGKSSLAAALVGAGWSYVTDERLAIRPDDARIEPFPRPLTLRRDMWARFPGLVPPDADARAAGERARVEVSPVDLGAVAPPVAHRVVAVVFPEHAAHGPDTLVPVATAAETVERLASSCHDLDRMGADGLDLLARWAALGPAWVLGSSELEAAVRLVDEAFTTGSGRVATAVERRPGGAGEAPVPGALARAADADAWRFSDGSAVVFRAATRQLARLDTVGLALWERLARPTGRDDLLDEIGGDDGDLRRSLGDWLDRMEVTGFLLPAADGAGA